jgi:hypothetical protein
VVVAAPVVVVTAPVVVVPAPVVVVTAPQGFGEHVPDPRFAPPALEHCVAVSRTQEPLGESSASSASASPRRQHWIRASVVVVVAAWVVVVTAPVVVVAAWVVVVGALVVVVGALVVVVGALVVVVGNPLPVFTNLMH